SPLRTPGNARRFLTLMLTHPSLLPDHLDAHVINRPLSTRAALRQRAIHGRPVRQELDVAGFHLHRGAAEDPLIKRTTLGQIRDLRVDMDLRAHRLLLSSTR